MNKSGHVAQPSFFHFILNKELDELYTSIAIRFFALSMIGIFLPIYLIFELGFSIQAIMIFFIISSVVQSLTSIIGAKIAARVGFKHLILFSIPFTIVFLLLLLLLPNYAIPLWLLALVGASGEGLYWIGHHSDLAKFTVKKARGEEVGLAFFVHSGAMLLGPIIGGLLLTYFNFTVLLIAASLLLLVSTVPLFFTRDFYRKDTFSFKHIFKNFKIKDALAYTAQGIEIGTLGVIWPIFIFIILGQYFTLGLVGSASALLVAVSAIFIGKWSDKLGKRPFLRFGAAAAIIIWLLRVFVKTPMQVYIITAFVFLRSLVYIPMDSLSYTKARTSKKVEERLVFRELFIGLGRILAYTALLVTSSYLFSFVFTGVAQLLLWLF